MRGKQGDTPLLDDLRIVLKSASGADYFDRVALLTGELYATTV
jgi:hypothetical protein